jgi:hypothetical protein
VPAQDRLEENALQMRQTMAQPSRFSEILACTAAGCFCGFDPEEGAGIALPAAVYGGACFHHWPKRVTKGASMVLQAIALL